MFSIFKKKFEEETYGKYSEFNERYSKLMEKFKHTPDILSLERRFDQFVLVVDELQHHKAEDLGEERHKISVAFTLDKFSFWRHTFGTAIPLEQDFHVSPKAIIKGELYLVKSQRIFQLDNLKRNGVEFTRKRVKVVLPYRMAKPKDVFIKDRAEFQRAVDDTKSLGIMDAWMYVGVPEYWEPLISSRGTSTVFKFNKDTGTMVRRHKISPSFSAVDCFQPNDPKLDLYYYLRSNASRSDDN